MTPSASRAAVLGAFAVLGLAALSVPRPAAASVNLSTSAGGACKPAYGASASFRFSNFTAENIGTTDQYLVCTFADFTITDVSAAQPITLLSVAISSGTYPGTVSCLAQMGGWYGGFAHIGSSSAQSRELEFNDAGFVNWTALELPRSSTSHTLVLNCKVPRGFKVGAIERVEPEPASGDGWTP